MKNQNKSKSEQLKDALVALAAQLQRDYDNGNFSDVLEALRAVDPITAAAAVGLAGNKGLVGFLAAEVYA